jgi:pyridoxamine 5'-phosphate oxidase
MTLILSELRKEYLAASLDEQHVHPDPLFQFNDWLNQSMDSGVEEPNAMVLSTSDREGHVSARVVLLKGIEKDGFLFFTSYVSRKGLQLQANPNAALTFHWHLLERQVRVEGKVVKISRKASVEYFNSRPEDSRISAAVSPQSSVIPDRSFIESMREGFILDLQGSAPKCPDNWGGYCLKPSVIEFWQGRARRLHDRIRYRIQKGEWIIERLAP